MYIKNPYPKLYIVKREFFESEIPDKVINIDKHEIKLYRIAGDYDIDFVICIDNSKICYDFMYDAEKLDVTLADLDIIEDELIKMFMNIVMIYEIVKPVKIHFVIPLLKYVRDFDALEEPYTNIIFVGFALKHKDTIQYPPYVTTPLLLLKAMN